MTDDQDGRPRRQAVDGPTVMGPSTGHLHGPAPEEPTIPAATTPDADPPPAGTRSATPRDEPTPAPNAPALPDDERTIADPPATPPAGTRSATRDEPTLAGPSTPTATPSDEPTIAAPPATAPTGSPATPQDEPTLADSASASAANWPVAPVQHHEPAVAAPAPPTSASNPPATPNDEPTLPEPRPTGTWPGTPATAWPDEPTVAAPVDEVTVPDRPDDPTMAVVDESPTTTGPTVASWPLDELLPPPPTDLVWRPDTPEPPPAPRRPAYYVALGGSVVLVVALIAVAVLVTVVRPAREVAGTARPTQAIPDITGSAPPPTTTTVQPQAGPAEHPLSTSTARMADATCALPRFDLADDRQAAFYAAAKTCADDAWRGVLDEAGLTAAVEVVTVTGPVRTASCGEITPASPASQCDGTVYMTPAHLRDTEGNGRYPGRYFGVFLREYARALQFTTGLSELAATVDDAEVRLAQQATCMAGIASGAMANRGAVDANITGEISDRLSSVDGPPEAKALLDKGFEERNLSACNVW